MVKGINKVKKLTFVEVRYVAFGNFIINHFKLNENKLLIKYPGSHAPVPKIRSTIISNDFKRLMIDLLDTKKINIDLQKKLNATETTLFELLLRLAGLKEHLNYKKHTMSIDDYVHRFEVLRGELIAGNDSNEMKIELINIIKLLNNKSINKISDEDAQELIEILK